MAKVSRQTRDFVLRAACRPGGFTEPDLWAFAGAIDSPHGEERQAVLRSAIAELLAARLIEQHGAAYEATYEGQSANAR